MVLALMVSVTVCCGVMFSKIFLCRFGEPGVSAWSGCLCCEVRGGTMGAMNLG